MGRFNLVEKTIWNLQDYLGHYQLHRSFWHPSDPYETGLVKTEAAPIWASNSTFRPFKSWLNYLANYLKIQLVLRAHSKARSSNCKSQNKLERIQ